MKQKVIILNITHGDNVYFKKESFLPIAAGGCRNDILNDACGDDNISSKNKYYGDFTSIYWAWKYLKGVDVIGTSHYRRYIADIDCLKNYEYDFSFSQFNFGFYSIKNLVKHLEKYDFVMLKQQNWNVSVKEQYLSNHVSEENLKVVTVALSKIHPEAVVYWQKYLSSYVFQPGYLFLTKWKFFDEMCEWLYPVLVEVEKNLDLNNFCGYQERVIAFLYERLVPVFIYSKGYTIKGNSLYFISENEGRNSLFVFKLKYYLKMTRRFLFRC